MIIFGWGGGKPKDLGPALPNKCARCGREEFARYFTVTKWFSLFFIPLIPYSTKHFLVCPTCTNARELTTRETQARAEQLVALTARYTSGAIDEQTYLELLDSAANNEEPAALPGHADQRAPLPDPPRLAEQP
jgi:zinc-ribbon family